MKILEAAGITSTDMKGTKNVDHGNEDHPGTSCITNHRKAQEDLSPGTLEDMAAATTNKMRAENGS